MAVVVANVAKTDTLLESVLKEEEEVAAEAMSAVVVKKRDIRPPIVLKKY